MKYIYIFTTSYFQKDLVDILTRYCCYNHWVFIIIEVFKTYSYLPTNFTIYMYIISHCNCYIWVEVQRCITLIVNRLDINLDTYQAVTSWRICIFMLNTILHYSWFGIYWPDLVSQHKYITYTRSIVNEYYKIFQIFMVLLKIIDFPNYRNFLFIYFLHFGRLFYYYSKLLWCLLLETPFSAGNDSSCWYCARKYFRSLAVIELQQTHCDQYSVRTNSSSLQRFNDPFIYLLNLSLQ